MYELAGPQRGLYMSQTKVQDLMTLIFTMANLSPMSRTVGAVRDPPLQLLRREPASISNVPFPDALEFSPSYMNQL